MKKLTVLLALGAAGMANASLVYDNTTTFTGFGATAGGAAAVNGILTTNMILDDLTMTSGSAGQLTIFKFTTVNFNAAPTLARMRVRWFLQDGASGGPGTALGGFSFAATSIGVGATLWTADVTANNFMITSSNIWAGVFFDNSGAAATTATELNNLGQALFNPPTVGSSADKDFLTTTPGSFLSSNPAGAIRTSPFSADPVANYGWQINTVPEPASMVALGAGLLALARRRRTK